MILIKKYANRRLYDTSASAYITLSECADIIRAGTEVQIIDAKSKQDITVIVMIQIIMECEQNFQILPVAALRQIIKVYGSRSGSLLSRYLERTMSSFAHHHLDLDEALEASLDAIEKDRQPEIGRPAQTDVFDSRKRELLEQLQIEMKQLSARIQKL